MKIITWLKRSLNVWSSPEGCTAVDAQKLRQYNHSLAIENNRMALRLAKEIKRNKP